MEMAPCKATSSSIVGLPLYLGEFQPYAAARDVTPPYRTLESALNPHIFQ